MALKRNTKVAGLNLLKRVRNGKIPQSYQVAVNIGNTKTMEKSLSHIKWQ